MNGRNFILWMLTIFSFFGIMACLGQWIDQGGTRSIVAAVVLLLLFIICMPTDDKDDS